MSDTIPNDRYARALAFAGQATLVRLLLFLQEKQILTHAEIDLLFAETRVKLSEFGTVDANNAIGVIANMRDKFNQG